MDAGVLFQMKFVLLTSCVAFLAVAQTPLRSGDFDLTADKQEKTGAVVHLSGHAAVRTAGLVLEADAVDFNGETRTMVARGKVTVSFQPGDFDLTADMQEKTGAVVHLSGRAAVRTAGLLLEADAVDFNGDTRTIISSGEVHIQLN
jgi:lipopolysaccharide assembly outer membrane protein LptD (OstA)